MNKYYNLGPTTAGAILYGEARKLKYLIYRLWGAPSSDVTANSGANTAGCSQASLTWNCAEKVLVGYNDFQNYTRYFYQNNGGYAQVTPNVISEASGTAVAVSVV